MILDRLEHISRYTNLGENFSKAVSFLMQNDVFALPLESFEIDGRLVYGFAKETQLTKENPRWEAHQLYADIQLILGGAERMNYIPTDSQPMTVEYNPTKDVAYYEDPSEGLGCILKPGDFMVFLPGELHRPDCPVEGYPFSRKVVIKVRMH